MKKKGYYEYNSGIYPRRLWVMYDTSEDEIDKCFTDTLGDTHVICYDSETRGKHNVRQQPQSMA